MSNEQEIKQLVVERLKTLPDNAGLSIGAQGEFNRDELKGNNILDEWGNYLVYRNPGTQTSTTGSYDLYSVGSDGVSNTFGNDADDINNWSQ